MRSEKVEILSTARRGGAETKEERETGLMSGNDCCGARKIKAGREMAERKRSGMHGFKLLHPGDAQIENRNHIYLG